MKQLTLIVAFVAAVAGLQAQSIARLAANASAAYDNENYYEADSLYKRCIVEDPARFDVRYNAGLTQMHLNVVDSALNTFEYALPLADSSAWKVHYNMGNCHLAQWIQRDLHLEYVTLELEDLDLASGDISERLQAFIFKDSLLALQGTLLDGKMDALDDAINAYKSSLRRNPSHDDARYNLLWAKGKIPVEEEPEPDGEKDDKEDQDKPPPNPELENIKKAVFEHIKKGDFEGAYEYLARKREGNESLSSLDDLLEKLGIINEILHP